MQRENEGEWKAQYRFTLQPYEYADYFEMCRYHQTSPQSHFTQRRICSRLTEDGRVTLSEMRFITASKNGERQERILTSQKEYEAILSEHFGIAGLRQISEWRIERIQKTLSLLTDSIAEEALRLGCAVSPAEQRVNHFVGIRLPGGVPDRLGERLAAPKIYVGIRGDAIRIAPHLYTDERDIEKLFTALKSLI